MYFTRKMIAISPHIMILFCLLGLLVATIPPAEANRFTSTYPCQDNGKHCVSSGTRKVDGFEVTKDCWEWSYTKTCAYPSKNDCRNFEHCYLVSLQECLLRDSLGNCVNQVKEFSCSRLEMVSIHKDKVQYSDELSESVEQLLCKGFPCLDGNCVDKSYEKNNEIFQSTAKLKVVSQMKGKEMQEANLFPGIARHCTKKAIGFSNCCNVGGNINNWGYHLGARCTAEENNLIELLKRDLCIPAGHHKDGDFSSSKHYWCCYSNMLSKVIREAAFKNLGVGFGTAPHINCRGLAIDTVLQLDFDKLDFSAVEVELSQKMKLPNNKDFKERVSSSFPKIKTNYPEKGEELDPQAGINQDIQKPIHGQERY